ncbi:adhesion G-protein coupled receptor G5-like, partial [Polypterus senegalus]|uniref:adhesion G-protein coupled receptor G5-like n=1 Tax=Polypterus senegalus TaxID=55291 RepID=UPI0019623C22
ITQQLEDTLFQAQFPNEEIAFVTPRMIVSVKKNCTSSSSDLTFGSDLENAFYNVRTIKNLAAEVTLPSEVFKNVTNDTKSLFAAIWNTSLFQDSNQTKVIDGLVFGVVIQNAVVTNLRQPVVLKFSPRATLVNANLKCGFWSQGSNDIGGWNRTGCSTLVENNLVVCSCTHLTYFAVLMAPDETVDANNKQILTYITSVGCGISAFCMTIIILVHPMFVKKPSFRQSWFIHLNLAGALLLLNVGFLCSASIPAILNISWLCTTTGLALHFSLICSFTWMALEAFQMFLLLWRPFTTYIKRYTLKACLVGWGVPALIVLTIVAVNKNFYGPSQNDMCWITNQSVQYSSVTGYYALVFIFTTVVFIAVVYKMFQIKLSSNSTVKRESNICMFITTFLGLTCLIGTTWGLGFFLIGSQNLPVQYLFTILNSFQGFFLFIWICCQWNKGVTSSEDVKLEPDTTHVYSNKLPDGQVADVP